MGRGSPIYGPGETPEASSAGCLNRIKSFSGFKKGGLSKTEVPGLVEDSDGPGDHEGQRFVIKAGEGKSPLTTSVLNFAISRILYGCKYSVFN